MLLLALMINLSGIPWNKHDLEVKRMAEKRCTQIYKGSHLKKFFKIKENTYRVICGY